MTDETIAPALRRLIGRHATIPTADVALLQRYAAANDAEAFAALVRRHGPMVWGVCRRVVREEHAAEDAFQATFLVLAKKATSIRAGDSLAGWLYRVAFRLALSARPNVATQPLPPDAGDASSAPEEEAARREAFGVLDEEVNRLPERYRLPVTLCFFAGRTHAEAAVELGWPVGTVAGRLARAKDLLHQRLTRRGVTLAAGAFAVVLSAEAAQAAAPAALEASVALAAGTATGRAAQLAGGLLKAWRWPRLWAAVALLVLSAAGALAAVAAFRPAAHREEAPPDDEPEIKVEQRPVLRLGQRIPRQRMMHERRPNPEGHWNDSRVTMALSSDGRTLASAAEDGSVKLWDVQTGEELAELGGHKGWALSVAFSPDGKTLASSGEDRTVKLWDVKGRKLLRTLEGHGGGVWQVAFSPDGKTLASAGGGPGPVRTWDVKSGEERRQYGGDGGDFRGVAFTPDGKTLVCSKGFSGMGIQWDVASGKVKSANWGGMCLGFSPDGKKILLAGGGNLTVCCDLGGREAALALKGPGSWRRLAAAFSPDGQTLATGDEDGVVRLRDARTGKERAVLRGHREVVTGIAFTPDGQTLITCSNDRTIKLWDVPTAREQGTTHQHLGFTHNSAAFSPDRTLLAFVKGGPGTPVVVHEVATGKCLHTLNNEGFGPIEALAFSRDGKTVAAGGSAKGGQVLIRVWDVQTGKAVADLKGTEASVISLHFFPDGATLASSQYGGGDDRVILWDVRKQAMKKKLPGSLFSRSGGGIALAVSPDGKRLAGNAASEKARIWNVETEKVEAEFDADQVERGRGEISREIVRLAFSPDGSLLATGSRIDVQGRGVVTLWDAKTGKALFVMRGHKVGVRCLAFSPDGKTLASGDGRTIRLWDVKEGKLRSTLWGHPDAYLLAFSADGKTLLSVNYRQTLSWDVSPEK